MPTTSTEISRSKLQHPDLNHDGGASLHAKIATLLTTLGDNANSRYSEHVAVADNNFVTIDHNFGANLTELSVLIYSGTGATKELILDTATAGYAIAEESGSEETQIRVTTPGSGGPHTFTVFITDAQLKPFHLDQLLASAPASAATGTIRKWMDTNGRGLTKTATGVIGTQQTLNPVHTAGPAVTALPGFHYIVDSSGAAVTVTLPATIADYDRIRISDATKSFNVNSLTIARNGNSINGDAADLELTFPGEWIELIGDDTNSNWIADLPTAGATEGGESGTNYFTNGNFENNATDGVSNDAGGTPVQFTEEVGSPLFGARSSLITSQAGTGYVDYEIAGIDNAVISGGILLGLTAYIQTSASSAAGEWQAGIYNVTDAVYESSVDQTDLVGDSLNVVQGAFIPLTGKTYVLRVNFTDTTAAKTCIVDKLVLTPDSVATGAVVTPWESYTPTGNFTTNTAYAGKYRRVGESMEVMATISFSGAPNATNASFSIPTGFTIDTGSLSDTGTLNQALGSAHLRDSTANLYSGVVTFNNTTSVYIIYDNGNVVDNTSPFTIASGDLLSVSFSVPIAEWSGSGTVNLISDNVVTANVRSKWILNNGSHTSGAVLDFDTQDPDFENIGQWPNTDGSISIPVDGTYDIKSGIGGNTGNFMGGGDTFQVFINGAQEAQLYRVPDGATQREIAGSTLLDLQKGDVLSIRLNTSSTSLSGNTNNSYLSIQRVADYSAGQPVGFGLATTEQYGLVKKNKWKQLILGSDRKTTGVFATFNNLVENNFYKATLSAYIVDLTSGADTLIVDINDGATPIARYTWQDNGGDANGRRNMDDSVVFQASSNGTLTFEVTTISSASCYLGGNPDPAQATRITLEELNNYSNAGTDWD